MCGRYTDSSRSPNYLAKLGLESMGEFKPRYNVAPTQEGWIVTAEGGKARLRQAKWGLIPAWANDPGIGNSLINARSETVSSKPAFRDAFRKRRCLVLADGFFEWQKTPSGKQPFHFHLKGRSQFAFAGLWENWTGVTGEITSYCLITVGPNELVAPVHNRMPAILPEEKLEQWLDSSSSTAHLETLLASYPSSSMEGYPVNKAVNRAGFEGELCIQRVPGEELLLF